MMCRRLKSFQVLGVMVAWLVAGSVQANAEADPVIGGDDDGFFFVQISDAHVYDKKSDFASFSSPAIPWYLPELAVNFYSVSVLKRIYGPDAIDKLRSVLEPTYGEQALKEMWDVTVFEVFSEQQLEENSSTGTLDQNIRSALREVNDFDPLFVINTGDMVLEGNNGTPEAIDRWFKYWIDLTGELESKIYNTIGNNEIAGTQREDFKTDDPKFGKFFFKQYFGETHYSFDYGRYHFVALDTHAPDPRPDNADYWSFGKMEPAVKSWAEEDLSDHEGRVIIVLNHEPFHFDDGWPFKDNGTTANDEGLFQKYGVSYVLSGHTHYRSYQEIAGVHHITTGALSGMRWVLPTNIHARGYRFLYAKNGELFSAWKETGLPVATFSEPQPKNPKKRMLVLSEKDKGYKSVIISQQGVRVPVRRLGNYFYEIDVDNFDNPIFELKLVTQDDSVIDRQLVFAE